MRSLPIVWRMAEDLKRLAMPTLPFFEHPWTTSYRVTPFSQLNRLMDGDLAKMGKDGYHISMNVAEFKPDELSVKVVDNNVIVEGRSEQQHENQGYISRHFLRSLALPKGYEADNAISTLSSDGILTVSVPKPLIDENVREIPIQQTETPSIEAKPSLSTADGAEKPKDN